MHHQTNDGAEADAEGASPRGRAVAFFPVPPVLSTPDYVVAFESVGAPDSGGEGCRGGAGDGDGGVGQDCGKQERGQAKEVVNFAARCRSGRVLRLALVQGIGGHQSGVRQLPGRQV